MVQIHQGSSFYANWHYMRTFRFKIFVSYLVLLIIFLSFMFPFVTNSVQNIVLRSMSERADELIETIVDAEDDRGLIQALKDQKHLLFFRVGLIDENLEIVYDSHTKRLIGSLVYEGARVVPLDVIKAFEFGTGYSEEYSPLLGQKLIYLSKSFDFQRKRFILRLAFPAEYMQELKRNFEVGLVIFSSIVLILFSAMTGFVVYHFTNPIRQIIRAIKPYQEGKTSLIPEIRIKSFLKDEFSDLAKTFNLLSERIKGHIETLTHERNEKEAILQNLAEGVLAVDSSLKVSYANSMALSLLGINHDIVGEAFPKHLHPKCYELLLRCHEEAKLFNDALKTSHNGKTLHLNIVASPREKQGGAILVLQDKSIHYKILEMRKDFIANASHELKTPITIIHGFAETLHDNPGLDQGTITQITTKIVSSCNRMTKIIQNLLTLADIENLPRSKLQEFSLKWLATSCKESLLSRYKEAKIEIQASECENFVIEADPDLIEVALMNLLENAIKYSKDKKEILLVLENHPGYVKVQVKDKGIGIPEQDLEHIFQRFYTVNKAESKKLGGSGLGLSIVETIVEKHFGKVYVESRIGEGSTFTMHLPNNLGQKISGTGTHTGTTLM